VRLAVTPRLEFDFEGVARLTRDIAGQGPGASPLYGGAFYWRLLARF
jgi:hypothetical protein